MRILVFIIFLFCNNISAQDEVIHISGNLKKWNKVTLNIDGVHVSENDADNPFLNYRLDVLFKNGDCEYLVPGFFAADGKAAETSSNSGSIWKVRFRPDKIGKWTYKLFFRKGDNIAIDDRFGAGEPTSLNGRTGSFIIEENNKRSNINLLKGRIQYTGKRYLYYAETMQPFLKGGANSPENFLAYFEFDQTPLSHTYAPHGRDWKKGDPTWQNGKGKNIIGALNYLASKGMNSVYFLTMNVQGDGKDTWPWIAEHERYRFDCSKLDQWEIVFDHMDSLGLMLHVVLQETENELLLDIGNLGIQRKLYLREMIARFSNHLGVTWNLGEENGPVEWSPKGQDDGDRKAMAQFLKENDPYQNFVAVHTHSVPEQQMEVLEPLLGFPSLDGSSIQVHSPYLTNSMTKKWILESEKVDKPWVVSLDEIGPADIGAKPDMDDPQHNEVRGPVLWGNLMAGGAGVEWYFGYTFDHMDLNCEDWRSRDVLWNQTKIALDFFQEYLPFENMHAADGLTPNPDDFVFVKNREVYAIYLPKVETTKINLSNTVGWYTVRWFNPRVGGELEKGSIGEIKGGGLTDLGYPPDKNGDWVALLTNDSKSEYKEKLEQKVISLDALSDFKLHKTNGVSYYRDEINGVLAINTSNKNFRNKFALASTIFKGETGLYKTSFISTSENDGESRYIVSINGTVLDTLVNPVTSKTFETTDHALETVFLHKYDIIEVRSNAVTNGKIPESNEFAWSRGRWNALKLVPYGLSIKQQLIDSEPFEEHNGFVQIEAESFQFKTNNGTKRDWYIKSLDEKGSNSLNTHEIAKSANGHSYIQVWPDTRITHDDPLIHGENFFPIAGMGAIVSYKVRINNPGKYYVWASAYSSGSEDNGVHIGINEEWPESGSRIQWCENKGRWTWSSAQRIPENHCGMAKTIFLQFEVPGDYIVSFSVREDGFNMDRFILTKDDSFIPE